MISGLIGVVGYSYGPYVDLWCNNVMYRVYCPRHVIDVLQPGMSATLHTSYKLVAEEARLFGFECFEERDAFERLVSAKGVGPSIALRILTEIPYDRLEEIVKSGDSQALCAVKGVGKNSAEAVMEAGWDVPRFR